MAITRTLRRGVDGHRVDAAQALARTYLKGDRRRLGHVAGAARAAAYASAILPTVPADIVVSAAWLHDIGHAPELVETGFHPVDGALLLQREGWDDHIVRLVAHHAFSRVTAPFYGAQDDLAQFAPLEGLVPDVLTFADVIAGVDGRGATLAQRLAELRARPRGNSGVPPDVSEHWYALITAAVTKVQKAIGSGSRVRTGSRRPR